MTMCVKFATVFFGGVLVLAQTITGPEQRRGLTVRAVGSSLRIGDSCTVDRPCNVRLGQVVVSHVQPGIMRSMAGSGAVDFTITPAGLLTAYHNFTSVLCEGGLQCLKLARPPEAIMLAQCFITAGVAQSCVDLRAEVSHDPLRIGNGLMLVNDVVQVNPAVIGSRVGVPATPTAACMVGEWASDTGFFYVCVQPDSWRRVAISLW